MPAQATTPTTASVARATGSSAASTSAAATGRSGATATATALQRASIGAIGSEMRAATWAATRPTSARASAIGETTVRRSRTPAAPTRTPAVDSATPSPAAGHAPSPVPPADSAAAVSACTSTFCTTVMATRLPSWSGRPSSSGAKRGLCTPRIWSPLLPTPKTTASAPSAATSHSSATSRCAGSAIAAHDDP